jgi:hypothetical protein
MVSLSMLFCYRFLSVWRSYNPETCNALRFRLFPFRSPLLRESHSLSLPPGTEMFHFPGFAPLVTEHYFCRVTPFGNPRIKASFPTPRGLSPVIASFIASLCQGIHHMLLVTYRILLVCHTNHIHELLYGSVIFR